MNELELAKFVDEVAEEWRRDQEERPLTICTNAITVREAELATMELHHRDLPITVYAVWIDDNIVEVLR